VRRNAGCHLSSFLFAPVFAVLSASRRVPLRDDTSSVFALRAPHITMSDIGSAGEAIGQAKRTPSTIARTFGVTRVD
jgi:hypothetical protein